MSLLHKKTVTCFDILSKHEATNSRKKRLETDEQKEKKISNFIT